LDNSDAKVILHPLAVDRLRKGQNSFDSGCTSYMALTFCRILKLLGKGEHGFLIVDRHERYIILEENTKPIVAEQLYGTVLYLPGHTKDSIGLILKVGSLF